jgi:DNA-binding transcriptional MerR regulator
MTQSNLIRLSELAKRSGVPSATIKHYVREGLLPGPSLRTGRTMAYYDPALITRVKAIKELQQKRFLPLAVIRDVLDGADPYKTEETEAALAAALRQDETGERRTRKELLAAGMPEEQLAFFESVGFVEAEEIDGEPTYGGADLALLRTLGAARRAGITPEMLPHTIVGPYVNALRNLVRAELEMFREGLLNQPEDSDLTEVVEASAKLSEQLVIQLRRKMLLPMLRELKEEQDK